MNHDAISLMQQTALQMLTLSADRFKRIQKEAPQEYQSYLVQVTKYQAAQHCKVYTMHAFNKHPRNAGIICYWFFIHNSKVKMLEMLTFFPNVHMASFLI